LAKLCNVSGEIFDIYADKLRGLPAFLGGMGITKLADVHFYAYKASFSSAAVYIYIGLISELMEPIQLGVGVSGGVEIVVHAATQFLLSLNNPENILLALDVKMLLIQSIEEL